MPRRPRLPHPLPRPGGPLLRRGAVVAAAGIAAVAGWTVARDVSWVQVRDVTVTGVSSSEGAEVRRALTATARQMTTLHVREDDLEAAVDRYSSVARIEVQTDFPHGLAVEVTEHQPIAEVEIAGRRVPVGAGGRLMNGVRADKDLPSVRADRLAPGGRITDPEALQAVATLAAAPEPLRERVDKVWTGERGLTLAVREGPELFFGTTQRLRAKWAATARVLAEPDAAGAVYLDVRIPDRVAAGGLGAPVATPTPDPLLQPEETPTLNP